MSSRRSAKGAKMAAPRTSGEKAPPPGAAPVILLAALIAVPFENYFGFTYRDPVGIPTKCYGSTAAHVVNDPRTWTESECRELLNEELVDHWEGVSGCIQKSLKPHEAAAVLSWTFNVGVGAACRSTLVRMLNAGQPAFLWCQQLHAWVYAGGRKLRGLVRRREAEYQMCMGQSQ